MGGYSDVISVVVMFVLLLLHYILVHYEALVFFYQSGSIITIPLQIIITHTIHLHTYISIAHLQCNAYRYISDQQHTSAARRQCCRRKETDGGI